ncbi:MAG: hypothetical protein K5656_03945 [Lachnospiraceae bacterium]|nr:hypothetical protein [Lachnospiraceae bacterium]
MFTCENCGGALRFDIASGKLICDSCLSTYAVGSVKDAQAAEESEEMDAKVFRCPQCGGEIMTIDEAAAAFCSYCGSSNVLESRMTGVKKPKYIIPFKKTKEDCKELYLSKVKKNIFAPKELRNPAYLDRFRGIYTPYWIYGIDIDADASFEGEESHRRGDYIIEDTYMMTCHVDANYDGISYDSSSSFDDEICQEIAPYPDNEFREFDSGYISGFYADVADVDGAVYMKDAADLTVDSVMTSVRSEFTGIDSMNTPSGGYGPKLNPSCNYPESAMFPVWFLSYRNKDRVAYGVVNGLTGKLSIDMPISVLKYLLFSILLAVPMFFVLNLGLVLTPSAGVIATVIMAIIGVITFFVNLGSIKKQETKELDKGYTSIYGKPGKTSHKGYFIGAILPIIAIVVALAIWFISPVSDIYYYAASLFVIVATGLMLIELIKQYNILSTRPLPQFNKDRGEVDA